MFASALQKRKAVVLSQSSQQLQQQQQRPLQLTQTQPAAPIAHTTVATTAPPVVTASASSKRSQHGSAAPSAASGGQSLSAMLSKRQKTETSQSQPSASSGFTTAKEWSSAAAHEQPRAVAAATATKTRAPGPKARGRAATANKARQQSSGEQSDEGVVFELSSKRRVTVRRWRAAVLIDIREYYDDNGVSKPGKKGISLSQDQWRALQRLMRSIDEAIGLVEDDSVDDQSLQDVPERISADNNERTIAFTLSSKRRISVRFFRAAVLVDLREFYDDNGVPKPGKKGIALSKQQWQALCASTQEVSDAVSQL